MSDITTTLHDAAQRAWRGIRRAAIAVHNGAVWLFEPAWTSLERELNKTDWRPVVTKVFGLMITLKVGFAAAAAEAIKDPVVTEAIAMLLGGLFIGFLGALTRYHHGLKPEQPAPSDQPPAPTAPKADPATTSNPTGPDA